MGNYDELDTARLTWVVLDRLVPPDDEPAARAALIARDPELHSLVLQGALTEDEAVEELRRLHRPGRSGAARLRAGWMILALLMVAVWLVTTVLH